MTRESSPRRYLRFTDEAATAAAIPVALPNLDEVSGEFLKLMAMGRLRRPDHPIIGVAVDGRPVHADLTTDAPAVLLSGAAPRAGKSKPDWVVVRSWKMRRGEQTAGRVEWVRYEQLPECLERLRRQRREARAEQASEVVGEVWRPPGTGYLTWWSELPAHDQEEDR